MIEDYPYIKSSKDNYGDQYRLFVTSYGYIELRLNDGDASAVHGYTPEQARKLAKRLKKAAEFATSVL